MILSDTSPISFPGLGIEVNPSDGFFIGNFEIKWYAVVIAFGLLLAVLYAMRRCKEFGLTADDIYNIVFVGLPAPSSAPEPTTSFLSGSSISGRASRGINA